MKHYVIITMSRKIRRITALCDTWWIQDWDGNGWDFGHEISKAHAKKLTREAVQLYVGK